MTDYPKPHADWPQPFPNEEYETRRQNVAHKLRTSGYDGILVTNPADINYLTGYDMIWFHLRSLTSCLIHAKTGKLTFFDYPGHSTIVHTTPSIESVVWLTREDHETASDEIVGDIVGSGLNGKRIAVQRWGYSPHADVMDNLIGKLRAADMEVGDGSHLIEELRLYKSEREIAYIRQAAQIADTAMTAAKEMLCPGVMETEIEATIVHSMMMAGGGYPSIRCMIGSGVRSGTHHSPAQHRKVKDGELVFVDFCVSLHRYHVNINRTFAVGKVDERWYGFMEQAGESIDHVLANIKPGDKWSRVQALGEESIARHGIGDKVWFVGGYALGISMPPDWVGEHWVTPEDGIDDRVLEPGMVFNLEGQYDVPEGWAGGTGAAFIESFLMTENGLEVLSKLPRTLVDCA